MNIYEIASELMNKHNLYGWSFEIHETNGVIGICDYQNKVISLHIVYASYFSEDYIRSVLLHEIAHALVGVNQHHNDIWKRKAKKIGSYHLGKHATKPKVGDVRPLVRDCIHPKVKEFKLYFDSIDEVCFHLKKVYGKSTEYWYNECLKLK